VVQQVVEEIQLQQDLEERKVDAQSCPDRLCAAGSDISGHVLERRQERKAVEDSVKTLHTGEPPWKLKFGQTS